MSVKCLVVGDVNGSFREVIKKISTLHAKNAFAFATVAGHLFNPKIEDDDADIQDLLAGRIEIPLPIYFALGTSPLPPNVVEKLESNNGEVCENLLFLGKRTTIKTSEGIRIVALGGVLDPNLTADASKDRYLPSYSPGDAKSLRGANTADILITAEWPKNILRGSKSVSSSSEPTTEQEAIADLCATLKPRYHFSTNASAFFEREPFFHPPPEDGTENPAFQITRFISLAPFGNANKQKWIYAFNIDPSSAPPVTLPPGTTPSPLLASKKRGLPSQTQSYSRFNTGPGNHHHHPHKRARRPPPGPESCFFCLSNPSVETHLVTSIGDDAYMTTAKGPLSTSDTFASNGVPCPAHMLIIPLPHVATLAGVTEPDARAATVKEMRRFRGAVQRTLASKAGEKLGTVVWEVSRAEGVHTHWQVLPVPAALISKGLVEAAFRVEAENEGYPSFEKKRTSDDDAEIQDELDRADAFRVWVWGPGDGDKQTLLSLPLSADFRFDLNFGRRVMAKLLGLEKRINWRDCTQSVDEETADAEAWKEVFKEWDFSLE